VIAVQWHEIQWCCAFALDCQPLCVFGRIARTSLDCRPGLLDNSDTVLEINQRILRLTTVSREQRFATRKDWPPRTLRPPRCLLDCDSGQSPSSFGRLAGSRSSRSSRMMQRRPSSHSSRSGTGAGASPIGCRSRASGRFGLRYEVARGRDCGGRVAASSGSRQARRSSSAHAVHGFLLLLMLPPAPLDGASGALREIGCLLLACLCQHAWAEPTTASTA
jgi:hypothetical protein